MNDKPTLHHSSPQEFADFLTLSEIHGDRLESIFDLLNDLMSQLHSEGSLEVIMNGLHDCVEEVLRREGRDNG